MNDKEKFIDILNETCSNRFDVDKFIKYLELTDFFEAPASTKYHSCIKGGLLKHSLNVYEVLKQLCFLYNNSYDKSTIAICGLLHDICKTNFYTTEIRNVKENGCWTTKQQYVIKDSLPLGHGEKSVILLLNYNIPLTKDEMLAIRWHMGGFDNAIKGGELAYSTASNETMLVTLLQCADLISTYIFEK